MKKILFLIFSIFLIFITLDTFISFHKTFKDENIIISSLKGIYFVFCLTGIFAFTGFVFPTYKLLPDKYYTIHHPKTLIKIYHLIGVKLFGKIVVFIFYNKEKIKRTHFDGKPDSLNTFINQTKQDEFSHLVPFVLITILCIYFLALGITLYLPSILLTNILLNFYPIIHQRHHRTYNLIKTN